MWGRWAGGGVSLISKNRPSHHKYKSPKQFLLIAYLNTSGLNGSKRTLCRLGATSYPISEDESQMGQIKNRPSEKRQTGLIYLLQNFESN